MNLEKLTNEELLKTYERLTKSLENHLTDKDADYKEKVKKELLKRVSY
ncbi:hypothetical protein R4Z09_11670 [Niallia oryzisoli]|uniref:Uncharacterized protein n=1 Tax=Niallia oryzisoli TaxID=1737571 RepID=A0ABZ2CJM0_9BACI